MGELFKSWRRRIGIMTLLVECVAMVGWVRSIRISDVVEYFPSQLSMIRLISWDGNLSVSYQTIKPPGKYVKLFLHFAYVVNSYEKEYPFDAEFDGCKWVWRIGHLGIATCSDKNSDSVAAVAPYWLITVPLTAISFWLLLSTPHKSNQKKILARTVNAAKDFSSRKPL